MKTVKKKTGIRLSALIAAIALLLSTASCASAARTPAVWSDLFFDTMISITLYDYPGSSSEIFNLCKEECTLYESLLSPAISTSDIWKIAHADSYPVQISRRTADIINYALDFCEMSDGLLDISAGALINLWDIKANSLSDDPVIPSDEEISKALATADYTGISIQDGPAEDTALISLNDPDCVIDLGCIAKGYIADRIDELLRNEGVTSSIINLGGNVRVIGSKPDGSPFRIGIQYPFADRGEPIVTVSLTDETLVTSGIYERYFEKGGHIYHHILDPRTGYPSESKILSASVRAPSSADADALSTICLLSGTEKGLELIEKIPGAEVLFITDDYETVSSSGW